LHVVNLIRDPRAIASSWLKKRDAEMAIRHINAMLVRQRQLQQWSVLPHGQHTLLRYEDLADRPRTVLDALGVRLGLNGITSNFLGTRDTTVSWASQHLYPPANERVLAERRTTVRIEPATEWRQAGHEDLHATVVRLAADLMERFFYAVEP
jgi:hypothetical protein